MMRAALVVALAVAVAGCSSSAGAGTPPPAPESINPCVTAGASYVIHFAEHPGGACGPIPDSVVNTEPNGTVTAPSGCTGESRVNGCTAILTGYSCPVNGGHFTVTGQINWAQDGSGATGTEQETLTAPNGETCLSTYDVTYRRQ